MIKEVTRILNETAVEAYDAMGLWNHELRTYDSIYNEISKILINTEACNDLAQTIRDFLKTHKGRSFVHMTRDSLYALADNLITYGKEASHKRIIIPLCNIEQNIFVTTSEKNVIKRLHTYGSTNMKYKDYLRYGAAGIQKFLKDQRVNVKVDLCLDSHEPMDYEFTIETGHEGLYPLSVPIMPTVLLTVIE